MLAWHDSSREVVEEVFPGFFAAACQSILIQSVNGGRDMAVSDGLKTSS
jgi:hypothetical protein